MLNCPTARLLDFLDPEEAEDSCGPAIASRLLLSIAGRESDVLKPWGL